MCWGNYEGPHHLDVPLKEILPILLKAKVGGLMLPFANPRHQHEMAVLRDIPLGTNQYLVAGVVDPLTNFIEHPEVIAQRIESATKATGDPRKVQAGTDCGFSTFAGFGNVDENIVYKKLESLVIGSGLASKVI